MRILIVSSSLNPKSRSRRLARDLEKRWEGTDFEVSFLDLQEDKLPLCDGGEAYSDESTIAANALVEAADGIVFASPVYVYNVNAALKNFVELTGQAMRGKVAGFLCAAGGRASYMSVMSLANSLMLDFRMHILPRFVYAASEDWVGDAYSDSVGERIDEFATSFVDLVRRLR